jgi:choline dehydrogenase
MAEALILEGKRCVGVRYAVGGVKREARALREVIVSGGSINSPKLLELSGIGQPEVLRATGITPVHELRGVGENLRDHYSASEICDYRPQHDLQRQCAGLAARPRSDEIRAVRHWLSGLDRCPHPHVFPHPRGLETPDATISILPFLYEMVGRQRRVAKRQGITMNANVLRSESTGSIHIRSADPEVSPAIRFNFLSTEHDRAGIVAVIRKGRELMAPRH